MRNLQAVAKSDALKGKKLLEFLIGLVAGLTGDKMAVIFSEFQINQITF